MAETKVVELTAEEAVEMGLIESVRNGEAKLSGYYELRSDGRIEFEQDRFTFRDKSGVLREGTFSTAEELCEFFRECWEELGEDE